MKLHHSQGCENGVFGGSQTMGLSWNLWAANVPCQDCRCSQCSQNFSSCGFAYEWQLCTTLSNPWEFNWGCNAHKQAKDPKDIGNSSSLIWMTFSTKKSVGSQILCYRFLVFQDKGNHYMQIPLTQGLTHSEKAWPIGSSGGLDPSWILWNYACFFRSFCTKNS